MVKLKCASCKGGKGKGKLLKCLHGLCVACLQQCVTFKGSLRCPACLEKTPPPKQAGLRNLPDVVLAGTDLDSADTGATCEAPEIASCDECMDEKPAVHRCSVCSLNFCDTHATVHSTSRLYHEHDLQDLNDIMSATSPLSLSSTRQSDQYCLIHPSKMMTSYCTQCKDLLCELCESQHNPSHKQSILTIAEAATNIRDHLTIRFDLGVDSKMNKLEPCLDNVSSAIQDLHDQTERVSKDVTDYFDNVVQKVKDREKQLLDDLDNLRNRKLLPLEEQKNRISLSMTSSDTAVELIQADVSETSFLMMSEWLAAAADRKDQVLYDDIEPCVAVDFKFTPDYQDDVTGFLTKTGRVADVTLNVKHSLVTTLYSISLSSEMKVEIAANDDEGEPVSEQLAAKAQLRVAVVTPDNQATVIKPPSSSAANKSLMATYQPRSIGSHTVMATVHDEHLLGSPVEVRVADLDSFDPAHCHAELTLSDYNTRVTPSTGISSNYHCVLGKKIYLQGQHHIAIGVELGTGTYAANCAIGMTSAVDPPMSCQYHPGCFGWDGYNAYGFCSGKSFSVDLGQRWQNGDVIDLWLNCEGKSLAGFHRRSGKANSIDNLPPGPLRLFVTSYYEGTSFHIK